MSDDKKIPAIKVAQWLENWDKIEFGNDVGKYREKPKPYFYIFKLTATRLKKLSQVYPRSRNQSQKIDLGIQRRHDKERSEEINRFLKFGFPLSESKSKCSTPEKFIDLLMPGWLPTAVVANILPAGSMRNGNPLIVEDQIQIDENEDFTTLILPRGVDQPEWRPEVPPLEIIDGQHRLWAFDESDIDSSGYELPIVAFYNLDRSWQAYLFYTINVKPKRINKSLAFDLYPLLRVEDWLNNPVEKASVYRETRAQEIVESLWTFERSPWHNRINMLGETKHGANITQAAFIRNLTATFLKSEQSKIGGLFGSKLIDNGMPLEWSRPQQIAFIIYLWYEIIESISNSEHAWVKAIFHSNTDLFAVARNENPVEYRSQILENVVFGKTSLISTDQGVRGFLHLTNDFSFTVADKIGLRDLFAGIENNSISERVESAEVSLLVDEIHRNEKLTSFIKKLCYLLAEFDWRTSSAPGLSDEQKKNQMLFKGSSGYKEIRKQLIEKIMASDDSELSTTAKRIYRELGYAENS